MAKEISLVDALRRLAQEEGITLTKEQIDLAEKKAQEEKKQAIRTVFSRKLLKSNPKTRETWVNRVEELSSRMSAEIKGAEQGKQGKGNSRVFRRMFGVETEHGKLTVILDEDVPEKSEPDVPTETE